MYDLIVNGQSKCKKTVAMLGMSFAKPFIANVFKQFLIQLIEIGFRITRSIINRLAAISNPYMPIFYFDFLQNL